MNKNSNIFIIGHEGDIGKAFVNRLKDLNYKSIITAAEDHLDLTNLHEVDAFFAMHDIDTIIFALEPKDKTCNVELYRTYLAIQTNVIDAAYRYGAFELLYIGDMDMYPSIVPQPIEETYLLSNYIDFQKEAYGLVKIMGVRMCQAYNEQYGTNFLTVVPSELYGHSTQDRIYKLLNMLSNEHIILEDELQPLQLLHVNDFIDTCLNLLSKQTRTDFYNIGPKKSGSIHELVSYVINHMKYKGRIDWIKVQNITPTRMLSTKRMRSEGIGLHSEGSEKLIEVLFKNNYTHI